MWQVCKHLFQKHWGVQVTSGIHNQDLRKDVWKLSIELYGQRPVQENTNNPPSKIERSWSMQVKVISSRIPTASVRWIQPKMAKTAHMKFGITLVRFWITLVIIQKTKSITLVPVANFRGNFLGARQEMRKTTAFMTFSTPFFTYTHLFKLWNRVQIGENRCFFTEARPVAGAILTRVIRITLVRWYTVICTDNDLCLQVNKYLNCK